MTNGLRLGVCVHAGVLEVWELFWVLIWSRCLQTVCAILRGFKLQKSMDGSRGGLRKTCKIFSSLATELYPYEHEPDPLKQTGSLNKHDPPNHYYHTRTHILTTLAHSDVCSQSISPFQVYSRGQEKSSWLNSFGACVAPAQGAQQLWSQLLSFCLLSALATEDKAVRQRSETVFTNSWVALSGEFHGEAEAEGQSEDVDCADAVWNLDVALPAAARHTIKHCVNFISTHTHQLDASPRPVHPVHRQIFSLCSGSIEACSRYHSFDLICPAFQISVSGW